MTKLPPPISLKQFPAPDAVILIEPKPHSEDQTVRYLVQCKDPMGVVSLDRSAKSAEGLSALLGHRGISAGIVTRDPQTDGALLWLADAAQKDAAERLFHAQLERGKASRNREIF